MRNLITPFILSFLFGSFGYSEVLDSIRFQSEADGVVQVLSCDRVGESFTVTLFKKDGEITQTVLLREATCKVVSNGFHCFIKPYKTPGILVTDVNISKSTKDFFDISKIMIINGDITALGQIGRDFVEVPVSKAMLKNEWKLR